MQKVPPKCRSTYTETQGVTSHKTAISRLVRNVLLQQPEFQIACSSFVITKKEKYTFCTCRRNQVILHSVNNYLKNIRISRRSTVTQLVVTISHFYLLRVTDSRKLSVTKMEMICDNVHKKFQVDLSLGSVLIRGNEYIELVT